MLTCKIHIKINKIIDQRYSEIMYLEVSKILRLPQTPYISTWNVSLYYEILVCCDVVYKNNIHML